MTELKVILVIKQFNDNFVGKMGGKTTMSETEISKSKHKRQDHNWIRAEVSWAEEVHYLFYPVPWYQPPCEQLLAILKGVQKWNIHQGVSTLFVKGDYIHNPLHPMLAKHYYIIYLFVQFVICEELCNWHIHQNVSWHPFFPLCGYSKTDKQKQEKHYGKTQHRLEITWLDLGFAPSNYLEKDHNLLLILLDGSQTSGSRGKGQKVKILSEQAAPPIPLSQSGFLTTKWARKKIHSLLCFWTKPKKLNMFNRQKDSHVNSAGYFLKNLHSLIVTINSLFIYTVLWDKICSSNVFQKRIYSLCWD